MRARKRAWVVNKEAHLETGDSVAGADEEELKELEEGGLRSWRRVV